MSTLLKSKAGYLKPKKNEIKTKKPKPKMIPYYKTTGLKIQDLTYELD